MRMYSAVGITNHEWLSSRDTRDTSTDISALNIDGEITKIGDAFSNGILYPGEDSEFSNAITLPVMLQINKKKLN